VCTDLSKLSDKLFLIDIIFLLTHILLESFLRKTSYAVASKSSIKDENGSILADKLAEVVDKDNALYINDRKHIPLNTVTFWIFNISQICLYFSGIVNNDETSEDTGCAGDTDDTENIDENSEDSEDSEDVGDVGETGDVGDVGDVADVGDVGDVGETEDVGDVGDIGDIGDIGDVEDNKDKICSLM
jgi:hypothetical protein